MVNEMPPPESFGIVAVRPDETSAAVSPAGDLDVSTSPRLMALIEELLEEGRTAITIDLRAVTFIDSSGLGALVSLLNRARTGDGQLGLICPHRRLRRVFEITGLRRAFVFGDDLDDVLAALAEGSEGAPARNSD